MKKIFIPLILVVIGATSQAQSEKKPPPPPPPKPKNEVVKFLPPVITVKGKMADEFYNRNPSVSHISRQGNVIILKKKDNTVEKYDMSKKEEDKNFTQMYGVSAIPPPPPPKVDMIKFVPPVIIKKEELDAFYKRNPFVTNFSFSIRENKITLKLKDDTKEEYNMNNKDENKNFITKYGNAPVPPPPPPPKKLS